jgi:hypothetical protein
MYLEKLAPHMHGFMCLPEVSKTVAKYHRYFQKTMDFVSSTYV